MRSVLNSINVCHSFLHPWEPVEPLLGHICPIFKGNVSQKESNQRPLSQTARKSGQTRVDHQTMMLGAVLRQTPKHQTRKSAKPTHPEKNGFGPCLIDNYTETMGMSMNESG